jgi:type I site-specific restriction endonuclease
VLDQTIRSMTEFKQIIGRGTRIEEDFGKLFFTILDFRKATELFADPDFDGDPVQIYDRRRTSPSHRQKMNARRHPAHRRTGSLPMGVGRWRHERSQAKAAAVAARRVKYVVTTCRSSS